MRKSASGTDGNIGIAYFATKNQVCKGMKTLNSSNKIIWMSAQTMRKKNTIQKIKNWGYLFFLKMSLNNAISSWNFSYEKQMKKKP